MTAAAALSLVRAPEQAAVLLKPANRDLLAHLDEPQSAASLARKLGLPRQRLNYHLRELEREGFVECVEERRVGNCTERLVRATARAFVISPEALGPLGTAAGATADRFSVQYLLATAARTLREVGALDARAKAVSKRLATLTIDAEVRFATPAARAGFAEALAGDIARRIAEYHDDRAPNGRTFRIAAHIHPAPGDAPGPSGDRAPTPQRRTKR